MLPFIAGAVAGAAVIVAFNNKKKIEEGLVKGASKAKELVDEKIDYLKSKKSTKNESKEEKNDD